MKKFSILLFSLTVTAVTAYGLIFPNYLLQELIAFSEPFVLMRLLAVLMIVSYAVFPEIRQSGMRLLLFAGSFSAFCFGIATLISPMFFGVFGSYVPIGDVFIFLESGIIGLLMAAELPVQRMPSYSIPKLRQSFRIIHHDRFIRQGS